MARKDVMAYHCPACGRTILSRRTKLCGFCREPLPAELLFTPAEVEEIEADERERALARKLREEERVKEYKTRDTPYGGLFRRLRREAAQPARMTCIRSRRVQPSWTTGSIGPR
jgi:hypothetical protein